MRGYPERTLATRAKWLLDTRKDAEVSATEWAGEMEAVLKELANAPETEPVAYQVRNGLVNVAIYQRQIDAENYAKDQQKRHDLSGSLAHFCVVPLYTAPPAPSVPVLTVECEPDYWSGGHYHEGTLPHIDPTAVWKLPIGTKLYTSPPEPSVRDAALVRDAERYRWLRTYNTAKHPAVTEAFFLGDENLDAEIDAAITAKKGGA